MAFYTYIMASGRNGTLYAGSTDSLRRRLDQHRVHDRTSFVGRYDVRMLVWFENHETREAAFRRERQIKEWRRVWKLNLIEEHNPDWRDRATISTTCCRFESYRVGTGTSPR